jgi:drug/metabolite transporter (DMT)-like permease
MDPGVLFGLGSAAAFGAGDFSGGVATRRASAWLVAAGAQAVGLALLLLLVAIVRPAGPNVAALAFGAVAGVFGGLGLAALYAGLSLGSMGLVAALSAAGSVAIPAAVGALAFGQPLSNGQWMGVAAAAGAGLLAGGATVAGVSRRAVQLAAVTAVAFGAWFVLLDVAADQGHELWSLVASRAAAAVVVGGVALTVARGGRRLPARTLPLVALAGALDVAGNAGFVLATTTTHVGVAAALSGLYPVVTMLLSWVLLRDRLPPLALAAVVLGVGGIVLLSVG